MVPYPGAKGLPALGGKEGSWLADDVHALVVLAAYGINRQPHFLAQGTRDEPAHAVLLPSSPFMISASVAPPLRWSRPRTLAVLLPSRALAAGFACLAALGALWPFLAGVAFFPALPLPGATRGFCART